MKDELTKHQLKILRAFYNKQQAAKEHDLHFSGRNFAKSMKMNYSTCYTHLTRLIFKGLIKEDKTGLTKKGINILQNSD